MWQRFGACRFAFREAEQAWAEHPALAPLRPRMFAGMAHWASDLGRIELAESYLEELGEEAELPLREALVARREARAREAARVGALEELAYQTDITFGVRFRRTIALALGALFVAVNFGMGAAQRGGWLELGYVEMLVTGGLTFAVFGPYAAWQRQRIFRNQANSTLFSIVITTGVVVQGLWLAGLLLELPFAVALGLTPIFYLLAFGAMTMLVSTRFAVSPLLQIVTAVLSAALPEYVYEIIGVGGGLSAALIGVVYRRGEERGDG